MILQDYSLLKLFSKIQDRGNNIAR